MPAIITLILGSIILGILNYKEGGSFWWGLLGGFVFIVIGLMFLSIFAIYNTEPVGEPFEVEQYKIQGLEDNISTNQKTTGAFILGCGYVNSKSDSEIKYYYFKIDEIGKKLETIKIDNYSNTYIRETDDTEPCLVTRYQKCKYTGFWKWFFGEVESENTIAEILVVPTNTIKIEYNIDI